MASNAALKARCVRATDTVDEAVASAVAHYRATNVVSTCRRPPLPQLREWPARPEDLAAPPTLSAGAATAAGELPKAVWYDSSAFNDEADLNAWLASGKVRLLATAGRADAMGVLLYGPQLVYTSLVARGGRAP